MAKVNPAIEAVKERRDAAGSKLPLNHYRYIYEDKNIANRIIAFREKHGTRYFAASTPEITLAAFLKILTERYGPDGDWIDISGEINRLRTNPPEKPDYTEDDISNLPASMQEDARNKLTKYTSTMKVHESQLAEYERTVKAICDEDAEEAYELCQALSYGEYEGFDFEYLEPLDSTDD